MSQKFENTVVLLRDEYQVSDFIHNLKNIRNATPVVLSPFALCELRKNKIHFKMIEEYYDSKDATKLGAENYKKVEQICTIIDKHLQTVYPEVKEYGLTPAFFSLYYLKIIYDVATMKLFQISKLIEKEKPSTIIAYGSEEYPFGFSERAAYLLFDNDESLDGRLLKLDGWDVAVSVLPSNKSSRENSGNSINFIKLKFKSLLQSLGLFTIAKNVKDKGLNGLKDSAGSSLVLFGGVYNWGTCEQLFKENGFGSFLRIDDNLEYWARKRKNYNSNYEKAFELISRDKELRKFFVYKNIDFFPFLESRIKFFLQVLVPSSIQSYIESSDIIKKKGAKAILFSTFPTCTSKSFAKAAKNSKIPVFNWQHGGHGYSKHPIVLYHDLAMPDVYFSFGKGMRDRYSSFEKKYNLSIVPIGSSALDALEKEKKSKINLNLDPSKKTILYASTHFHQNQFYVSIPPAFSDNLFYLAQESILDMLGKNSEYNIIVKFHDSVNFRESPLRIRASEKGYKNCTFIRNEQRFSELLSISDIVIIDFPAMTLAEVLTTKKPIFTTSAFYNMDKTEENILKKRAYCYSTIKQLNKGVNDFLNLGKPSNHPDIDLNNREFLKKYGTHLDDGKSAERAFEFVKRYV